MKILTRNEEQEKIMRGREHSSNVQSVNRSGSRGQASEEKANICFQFYLFHIKVKKKYISKIKMAAEQELTSSIFHKLGDIDRAENESCVLPGCVNLRFP